MYHWASWLSPPIPEGWDLGWGWGVLLCVGMDQGWSVTCRGLSGPAEVLTREHSDLKESVGKLPCWSLCKSLLCWILPALLRFPPLYGGVWNKGFWENTQVVKLGEENISSIRLQKLFCSFLAFWLVWSVQKVFRKEAILEFCSCLEASRYPWK